MDLSIKGRSAVVTGASAGIGHAIAQELAGEGVDVVLIARREGPLEAAAEEIRASASSRVLTFPGDVGDAALPSRLEQFLSDEALTPGILVNNAAQSIPLPLESDDSVWQSAFEIGFLGPRRLTQMLMPGMQQAGWGRVINVIGLGALEPNGLNAGVAGKGPLMVWSKGLARLVASSGITVNAVSPGRIYSDQTLRINKSSEAVEKFARERIPAGRFGDADEFAGLVGFLCSDRASYITGELISVDGGMRMYAF